MTEFRVVMMSTSTYNGPVFDHTRPKETYMYVLRETAISGSYAWLIEHWHHFTSHEFTWLSKKLLGKAYQLTSASGSSEYT